MARVREEMPHAVREIENCFIPMRDGCRLAARIWLPADADTMPVPALLEYIPYRKRDFMRVRDEPMHRYFAGHGYAAVRVDLRGSGDSDGVLEDEYLPQEQEDAVQVIEWLTRQPWCSGAVGMTGISWGGFNALQVAALAPPALKAIITLCAGDDRYADDAHYLGGCLLTENQKWGTVLFALNALPPDPELTGDRWFDLWRERLDNNRPFPAVWLSHQHRDAYWAQGSVCEDFSRIRCPVYAVGGWADGYSNAVLRLLEGLDVPRKGLLGPWAHAFPHLGVPGPAIGYLQEALRWWDHWLKGRDTGVMDEPVLRVWMQDRVDPEPFHDYRPGRWVAETQWPSSRLQEQVLHVLAPSSLAPDPGAPESFELCSPQSTGLAGGEWCAFGDAGEAPLDQRQDDGKSLVFDSAPLSEDLEILGVPHVDIALSANSPVAQIAVRLCDVAADGSSARVTFGLLNLTHRDGHATPGPLLPGEPVTVRVPLNAIAHRFAAGSVMRLALSSAYWPMVWPAPEPATLTILSEGTRLTLPVRPPNPADTALQPFEPPEAASPTSAQVPLQPPHLTRTIERDLVNHQVLYRMVSEGGDLESGSIARIEAIDLDLGHSVERTFSIRDNDPLSARAEMSEHLMLRRGDWRVSVQARTEMTATAEQFLVKAQLRALLGDREILCRDWDERIPRDLV
jgi:putative CocE/NonD family hydrolase